VFVGVRTISFDSTARPFSPARGPPTDWGEHVQVHDDRAIFQVSPDELPDIDIHSL
jgi:hypothetical protein